MTIRDYLKEHKLMTDGAFGTYYADLFRTQDMPELANTGHPQPPWADTEKGLMQMHQPRKVTV